MLSVSQRARLLESIPTFLGGYTVKKLRKDRLGNNDFSYPSLRIAIISDGIRVRPSTGGPIRKNYNGYQGDVQQWLGQHQKASISITLMAESEIASTDQETPENLDKMLYDLQQEIEIWRLGLYWPNDFMKVVPGSGKITYLPHSFSESVEHWIYIANFDFQVEYEFNCIDNTPNIHAIAYDWSVPCASGNHIVITDYHPPYYGMGLSLKGWQAIVTLDMLLVQNEKEKSCAMDMILISD